MKRILCLILAVAMMCTLLCGCNSNNANTKETTKTAETTAKTTEKVDSSSKADYGDAGLYQDGKRVKTWEQLLEDVGYDNFYLLAGLNSNGSTSYFAECSGDLILPDDVASINPYAFNGCSKLTSITLPDCLDNIGHHAFYGCSKLTSITIPDGVDYIGNDAFQDCVFTSIRIPEQVEYIDDFAFYSVKVEEYIVPKKNANYSAVDGVLYNKEQTKIIAYPRQKKAKSYIIPDTVTELNFVVFQEDCKFTELTIPSSITEFTYNLDGLETEEIGWREGNLKTIRYKAGSTAEKFIKDTFTEDCGINFIAE